MSLARHQVLPARVAAAQATVDAWVGREFAWGRTDCARMAAHTLKGLGYRPNIGRFGFYKSALSAQRALQREGFATCADWLDDLKLPRIGQASALPGDILGFGHPDQPTRVGLAIALGNGRMLAFLEDQRCHVVSPNAPDPSVEYLAWRAHPLRHPGG